MGYGRTSMEETEDGGELWGVCGVTQAHAHVS